MKIAPLSTTDAWYGRVLNNRKVEADALKGVPVETVVEMELIEVLHGGPEVNYRPFLHLRGELTSVQPSVELPYGVTELPLRRGSGQTVDAFYDFNHTQLADLVSKGYFTEAFKVPEAMSGIPWTLPGTADFLVVAPDLADDAPLVFMNVYDQHSLELDEANSGYELAGYFPDYTADAEASKQLDIDSDAPQRSDVVHDMFSDVDFEAHVPVAEYDGESLDAQESRRTVPDGVFSRLVAEIESKRVVPEPEPELVEEQPEAGSGWDFYMSRVAPGVDRVLAGDHLADDELDIEATSVEDLDAPAAQDASDQVVTVDSSGNLDFSDVTLTELTPLSEQLIDSGDDHLQAAARRTARLRAELAGTDPESAGDEAQPTL